MFLDVLRYIYAFLNKKNHWFLEEIIKKIGKKLIAQYLLNINYIIIYRRYILRSEKW